MPEPVSNETREESAAAQTFAWRTGQIAHGAHRREGPRVSFSTAVIARVPAPKNELAILSFQNPVHDSDYSG